MITLEYSIPLTGSVALALSISGGDIMNIILGVCSVAGRGGYGGLTIMAVLIEYWY